jgi:hypothetical protein
MKSRLSLAVLRQGIWTTGFVKWVAEKHGLEHDAAADLITAAAKSD